MKVASFGGECFGVVPAGGVMRTLRQTRLGATPFCSQNRKDQPGSQPGIRGFDLVWSPGTPESLGLELRF